MTQRLIDLTSTGIGADSIVLAIWLAALTGIVAWLCWKQIKHDLKG